MYVDLFVLIFVDINQYITFLGIKKKIYMMISLIPDS